jgi:hypothetical protein
MIDRATAAPAPTAVQLPVAAGQPATALEPMRTMSPARDPRPTLPQPESVSSWPNAGPAQGANPSWPNAGSQGQTDFGTQVLPVSPGFGDDYDDRASRLGYYQDPRRKRLLLIGALAGGTAVALALIALVVGNLSSSPPATPAAGQTQPLPATAAQPTPSAAQSGTQAPTPTSSIATASGTVTDSVSGLSYSMLSPPWNNGCPPSLSSQQTLTWTAGDQATAGQFTNNGQQVTWFAEACSAPLPQQYGYNGVADLPNIAGNLVNGFDGPYYGGLNHQRTQLLNQPVSISGHAGWEVKYLETYPDAASMGLPFNSEEGALVVVDQGTGLPPAVFFVSIPSNLGVPDVDALVSSLQLTATQSSAPQPGGNGDNGGQPGSGQPGSGGGNNP